MKPNAILAALGLLAGCATPLAIAVAEEGTAVPLNQQVRVGALVVTPLAVKEDSRCPENARCIWAGRAVVSVRIDGMGWHELAALTLGMPYPTHGTSVTLTSVTPEKKAGATTPARDYRFRFEAAS